MVPIGRPTKYKPEYCEMLIEHMRSCHTFESFAGIACVSIDTLYEWVIVHTDFAEAKNIGEAVSLVALEKLGLDIAKSGKGNPTPWIFLVKNRFRKYGLYEDRQVIESNNVNVNAHSLVVDKAKLTPESARQLRNVLMDGIDID